MDLVELAGYGDVRVVELCTDELKASNCRSFREEIEHYESEHLVLDLSRVTFVDSSGLGSLLALDRRLRDRCYSLKLAGLTRSVRTLFELMRLHRVIDIYNTVDDAVNAYKKEDIGRQ